MLGQSRYLISAHDQPRVRRAADATTVVVGALLLLGGIINHDRVGPLGRALTNVFAALPGWATEPLSLLYTFGFVYSVAIVVAMLAGGRRRLAALRDTLLAVLLTSVVGVSLVRLLEDAWPHVLPELGLDTPQPQTPVFRIAVVTTILVVASPQLARPMRRLGWAVVVLSAIAGSGLGYGVPAGAAGAVGLGMLTAGSVLLVFGSPRGYPDLDAVASAMQRLGTPVSDLRVAVSRSWGVRPVHATGLDGRRLLLKVYGRDAADSQVLAKAWRSLWYREQRRTFTVSRRQSVEHEALVILWAARAGIPVPDVVVAGEASTEVALLALTAGGERLDRLAEDEVSDDLLVRVWQDVRRLHAASISHGSLSTRAIRVVGASHEFDGLAAGSISATAEDRSRDIVELLFSLAAAVGAERTVATARAGVGDDHIVAALPYLQLPAIGSTVRSQADAPKALMKQLQVAVTGATGQQLPEPVPLRRMTVRTLVLLAAGILAALTIIPAIAGIDLTSVWDELRAGAWPLFVTALLVGQVVYITEAGSMMFATSQAVPFRPLIVLQIAAKLLGVAAPGAAGRVTANAAFLFRFGVSPAASLVQGAMDTAAGVLVEVSVLLVAFSFTDLDLNADLSRPDLGFGRLAVLLVAVIVIAVVVVTRVSRLRDKLVPVLRSSWEALTTVTSQPTRALGLLGSNLGTRIVHALVLWFVLAGLDHRLGLGVVLVLVIATSFVQAFVPVPGGIGVSEALMTGFLVVLGVPEPLAFAATITYRFVTFYLPIASGAVALRWLRSRDYL